MAIRTRKDGFSWSELKTLIPASLDAGVATVVFGSPGLGKSALACALADEYKLPLVDIRLAQQEPGDLAGVYFPDKDRERLQLLPPGWRVRGSPGRHRDPRSWHYALEPSHGRPNAASLRLRPQPKHPCGGVP